MQPRREACALYDGGDSGSIGHKAASGALFDNRIFRTGELCRVRRRIGNTAPHFRVLQNDPTTLPFLRLNGENLVERGRSNSGLLVSAFAVTRIRIDIGGNIAQLADGALQ